MQLNRVGMGLIAFFGSPGPRSVAPILIGLPGEVEVKRREIMPVFAARRMEPGLVLPVYVNPKDESDFILVW